MSGLQQKTLDDDLQQILMARPEKNADISPRLYMGDTTKRGILPKDSVDLIVTSPPYNIGKAYNGYAADDTLNYAAYANFSAKWLKNCHAWTRPTGRLCVNVSIDKNKNGKQPLAADITRWAMEAG